jgi:hypothetical protein
MTLQDLETLIGYTVASTVFEYKSGLYGDPEDWDAEKACAAEIDGDAGDQIRRRIKGADERGEACALWRQAIVEAWDA